MSFRQEVLDGLNAFSAMTNALKKDPYEEYWNYKMQTDPDYQANKIARERIAREGGDTSQLPGGRKPGLLSRIFNRGGWGGTAINTTGMPSPQTGTPPFNPDPTQQTAASAPSYPLDQGTYQHGGRVRGYQGGGDIRPEDSDLVGQIISAQVGEPNPANDPSIEWRERFAPRPTGDWTEPPQPFNAGRQGPSADTTMTLFTRDGSPVRVQLPNQPRPAGTMDRPPEAPRMPTPAAQASPQAPPLQSPSAAIRTGMRTPVPQFQTPGSSLDPQFGRRTPILPPFEQPGGELRGVTGRDAPQPLPPYETDYGSTLNPIFDRPKVEDQPLDAEAIKTTTYGPFQKQTPFREWLERPGPESEDAAAAREKMEDWNQRMADRKRTRAEAGSAVAKDRIETRPLSPQEMVERNERMRANEAIRNATAPPDVIYPTRPEEGRPQPGVVQPTQNLPAVPPPQPRDLEGYPIEPPAAPAAPTAPQTPPTPPPQLRVQRPQAPAPAPAPTTGGPLPPFEYPGSGAARAPIRPNEAAPPAATSPSASSTPVVGAGTGVGTGPSPGGAPGGGRGASPVASPPGAIRTEDPRTRTAAFDPTPGAEAEIGGVTAPRRFDAQGNVIPYGQPPQQLAAAAEKQLNTALAGATHYAQWLTRQGESHPHTERDTLALHGGVGAMPVNQAADIHKHWSDGGRLSPGQSLTRYMVYKYQALLEMGQVAKANQMAFGIVQRLNMEAASHATSAIDQARRGDLPGAAGSLQTSYSFAPDGRQLIISKDGTHMRVAHEYSNAASPPIPITPQSILALAMGLQDGTAIWNHLAVAARMHVSSMKGFDKDAEGRALRNEGQRWRNQILRQKAEGGGGKKVAAAPAHDPEKEEFFDITGGGKKKPSGGNTVIVQGGGDGTDALVYGGDPGSGEDREE